MTPATYATLDDWLAREGQPFSLASADELNAAIDRMAAALGGVAILGFGEALHGGEELLLLRNRLFQRLAEAHGYSAIALETSFPRGRLVDDYVAGRGPAAYAAIEEAGWSHGFGRLAANRELVEWMRRINAGRRIPLRFYGADSPTEMIGTDSPRQLLLVVLDYLDAIDGAGNAARRDRIERLLGANAAWENPAVSMDPTQGVGLSPEAAALRLETEDLISELQRRRPELAADGDHYLEIAQHAAVARQLLNYHAALARPSPDRISELLGIRDAMIADTLLYAVARERGRGKVLVFAHNRHLQRSQIEWQLGPHLNRWWPAGAHLHALLGPRYAVIGSGVGSSPDNGIDEPAAGTLESRLAARLGLIDRPQPGLLIPTGRGQGLPAAAIAALPTRAGSARNTTYMPLDAASLADFDWLAMLGSTGYARGGPPLP